MSAVPNRQLTPQEYLAIERRAEYKSEYFRGETFAMSGASLRHNRIATNVAGELHQLVKTRGCQVFQSDMRVKVSASGLYTYPDVVVVCGEPQLEDDEQDTLLNPVALIEVLSPPTEGYDRGVKFRHYRHIHSLMEYMLISQAECHVERFSRQPDDTWVLWETNDPQATLALPAIGCELRLADIYEKVEFDTAEKTSSNRPSV
ncbi:MAG: Uma2 family endonuclease [Planctomycetota bacterium]|nr:Uma2 family endonuclease [Planctomycetota bacterium]